jgi:hypothetical protein
VQPFANAVSNRNVVSGFASPTSSWSGRHETAREVAVQPRGNQREDAHDEKVGRDREDLSRFLEATQVADRQRGKEEEAQLDAIGVEARKGRRDGEHAGGNTHRHRQRVVDQQRRGRDEAGHRADVFLRDSIGAAARRIGVNRLPIREGDDREQRRDDEANGNGVDESGRSRYQQRRNDEIGCIRDRRQRV